MQSLASSLRSLRTTNSLMDRSACPRVSPPSWEEGRTSPLASDPTPNRRIWAKSQGPITTSKKKKRLKKKTTKGTNNKQKSKRKEKKEGRRRKGVSRQRGLCRIERKKEMESPALSSTRKMRRDSVLKTATTSTNRSVIMWGRESPTPQLYSQLRGIIVCQVASSSRHFAIITGSYILPLSFFPPHIEKKKKTRGRCTPGEVERVASWVMATR